MCYYMQTFQCSDRYNAVHKVSTQISKCRNEAFVMATLSAKNKATMVPCFLMKRNTCFMGFHEAKVKYANFSHRLV